jgi:hypothetical protein
VARFDSVEGVNDDRDDALPDDEARAASGLDDWDPSDPDAVVVLYDLSGWTFDQQAELASSLAEGDVPHTWDGTDLRVPEAAEAVTDAIIDEVEARLGIVDQPMASDDLRAVPLADDEEKTEYDLAEWTDEQREVLSANLVSGQFPFGWEDDTLVVHSDDEAEVEALLDAVESGEIVMPGAIPPDAERLPFETLTTFFLAGQRLQRNPLNADGLQELTKALDVADPARPPYGVDGRLWSRTCELAEELVDALVEGDEPELDEAREIAQELHDLLRPFV